MSTTPRTYLIPTGQPGGGSNSNSEMRLAGPVGDGSGPLPYIAGITQMLVGANVAVPIIFATIAMIRDLWKRAKPSQDVSDAELIDAMEAAFDRAGQGAQAEVERLRAELADSEG